MRSIASRRMRAGNKLQTVSKRFRGASQKIPNGSENFETFLPGIKVSQGLTAIPGRWSAILAAHQRAHVPQGLTGWMFAIGGATSEAASGAGASAEG